MSDAAVPPSPAGPSLAPCATAEAPADADLLALCGRALSAIAESDAICEPTPGDWSDYCPARRERAETLVREYHRLCAEAAGMRAVTPAGLRAKARLALEGMLPDEDGWPHSEEMNLAASVMRDVLRDTPPP